MPPPRFDQAAETWNDICPWCGGWEVHQVGTETPAKVVVWCRTCSGSSWLYRGADFLVARTPPKKLHDKRRDADGKRLPKQRDPVLSPPCPSPSASSTGGKRTATTGRPVQQMRRPA